MPRILSHSTCAILWVVGLVETCLDCGSIASGLLSVAFLSYVFRISEDVVVSIYEAV